MTPVPRAAKVAEVRDSQRCSQKPNIKVETFSFYQLRGKEELIAKLKELHNEAFQESPSNPFLVSPLSSFMVDECPASILMVAFDSNDSTQPLGYAIVEPEDPYTSYLRVIATAPEQQGKGVGSELMSRCLSHAKTQNTNTLALDVPVTHEGAIAFYLKNGFEPDCDSVSDDGTQRMTSSRIV